MATLDLAPASTADYRRLAEKRLPEFLFHYLDGGSYQEITLAENVADFAKLRLKQRVMQDVSSVDPSIELLGESWTMPMAFAPIGLAGMMARRAEVQAKLAADAFGIPFCLSTMGICSLEEIAALGGRPFWFQLYMLRDRGAVEALLQRAEAAGVSTLVFTVDLAVIGARYRDIRNGVAGGLNPWRRLRAGLLSYLRHPGWLMDVGIRGRPHVFGNLAEFVPKATTPADFKEWADDQLDASVTWKDIEWLRKIWKGRLVIKGVLSPEDARAAVGVGADAIVVSNHGGRQLDTVTSSIGILPEIADAVGSDTVVMLDGGIRSGRDVLCANALGADAALLGRPWVYALAAAGHAGLAGLLRTFRNEMTVAMALTGTNRVSELSVDILDRSRR